MLASKKYGWTARILNHQIEHKSYEKYLLNQTNFDDVLPEQYRNQAVLAVIPVPHRKPVRHKRGGWASSVRKWWLWEDACSNLESYL